MKRKDSKNSDTVTIIKKYANRRLYNTDTSSYITLDELLKMAQKSHDFVVQDAKSGEDITRSVLTQIILEAESKHGQNLLPEYFLRELVKYYGDQLNGMLFPEFIQQAMESFVSQQRAMENQVKSVVEKLFSNPKNLHTAAMGDVLEQNKAIIEQSLKLFNPFSAVSAFRNPDNGDEISINSDEQIINHDHEQELTKLQEQVDALREELEKIKNNP